MKVLVVVDVQNDMLPGGAVGVPGADRIIPVLNDLMKSFDYVVATLDWHPANHISFVNQHSGRMVGDVVQMGDASHPLWPPHCVAGTRGAAFAEGLESRRVAEVFRKGLDPLVDAYSGFFDAGRRHSTGLERHLQKRGAKDIYIAGLALDHAVRATALDAASLGFKAHVVVDACRSLNLQPGDTEATLADLKRASVRCIKSSSV